MAAWFRSEEATVWLDDPAPTEGMLRRMQRELETWQIQLIVALRETRSRIGTKFPFSDWLATPVALEQASDFAIARYKARRFHAHPAIDMCTGMGGDLTALAQRGETIGVDCDPLMAEIAMFNVELATGRAVNVRVESCLETPTDGEWVHIDPSRRSAKRRVALADFYEPAWQGVLQIIEDSPGGGAKTAPAAEFESADPDWELEWIERGGQCRQQMVWWKQAATSPGRHVASCVDQEGELVGQWVQRHAEIDRVTSSQLGEFLYEPSPSVLAAELVDDIADGMNVGRIAPGAVYLTGSDATHPLLSKFRIIDCMALDRKKMIGAVRQLAPRTVEVKKRGVDDFDPNEFQRVLKKKNCLGSGPPIVIVAARIGAKRTAIVAERIDS